MNGGGRKTAEGSRQRKAAGSGRQRRTAGNNRQQQAAGSRQRKAAADSRQRKAAAVIRGIRRPSAGPRKTATGLRQTVEAVCPRYDRRGAVQVIRKIGCAGNGQEDKCCPNRTLRRRELPAPRHERPGRQPDANPKQDTMRRGVQTPHSRQKPSDRPEEDPRQQRKEDRKSPRRRRGPHPRASIRPFHNEDLEQGTTAPHARRPQGGGPACGIEIFSQAQNFKKRNQKPSEQAFASGRKKPAIRLYANRQSKCAPMKIA